ncbi:uncharacterized protein [Ptychodera flava]|uniref:uncharacterized protein n=1 Tax=Ptychodera flava TaxID=63121 RepID=UPI00396A2F0E
MTEHKLSHSAEIQDSNNVDSELVVDATKTSDSTTGGTLSVVTCKIDETNIIDEESSSHQRFVATCGSIIHSLSCESASVEKIEVATQTENVDGGLTKSEHAETQTISLTMLTVATNFPEEPISHSDSETQTLQIFTECCKCGQFSTPESVRLSLDLKREQGQRLALEKLVSIVEQESRELRQQLLLERTSTCTVQNELIDMKAELTNARKVSSEYKMRVEELEQSLQGARQMVFKMEEQIENTNYFKSGVDYLLEAKLATSKSAEAQKKLEGVQTELLRSQQEVNHLLDKLAEMNREKTDMISSNVHHELLKISDQRAKDAELRSQQLEYEVRQLKNQLQASPKKTVSFAKHVTKPSSPTTTAQNVAKKSATTGVSQTKNQISSIKFSAQTVF